MGNKIVCGLSCFMLAVFAVLLIAGFNRPSAAREDPPETRPPATEPPVTEPPVTEPPATVPPVTEPPETEYIFGTPLGESERAEDEDFDSAVFLGDSRTEGLQLFGGLGHGDYYWARGMTVFRANDPEYAVFDVDGEKMTLLGALGAKAYERVYIMLGINELGYPVGSFEQGLAALLEGVLRVQPEAVIYLQTLPPINDALAEKNGLAAYERNANVTSFNEVILRLAREKRVVLLDTAAAYRGADGQLPGSLTKDGVHFTAGGYKLWTEYLRTHILDPKVYFDSRERSEGR